MGAECSKLRQPMRAILALSRAQLLLIVVTRSRDLSRECHVTKHKTPARSNFPMSSFENFGTIQFSSSRSTSRGLCPKNFEKRAHPTCQGPDPLYVTPIQKNVEKSLTYLKNRKFSKTWQDPIYRQNLVCYIVYTIYLGPCQGPDPLYVTPIQKKL